jgi:uncharacterized oxidoreductase
MTANINTILILGATSGLGEQFARYFYSKGKTVIAAGRRVDRLNILKSQLPDLEILQLDVEDFTTLESKLKDIVVAFPNLDAVFVLPGKMFSGHFGDPSTTTTEDMISEVNTNFLAPLIIARTLAPHLVSLKRPATFITVSSGLAYIPMPFYPVYNATKAAIHTFSVTLRMQLADTNVNVIELAPPYVDTDLDAGFRTEVYNLQGGEEKAAKPMPLKDYMASATAAFEQEEVPKEISVGFSAIGAGAWRGAFGPIFEKFGLQG